MRDSLLLLLLLSTSPLTQTPSAGANLSQPSWQRTESQHFEIHYLPALASELDRVVRSAERAYDRISGRLSFVFPTKVPSRATCRTDGPMTMSV